MPKEARTIQRSNVALENVRRHSLYKSQSQPAHHIALIRFKTEYLRHTRDNTNAVCFSSHCPWRPSLWLTQVPPHSIPCRETLHPSSPSPLLHSLHTVSSLLAPFHIPTSIWNAAVPPYSFSIVLLSLFLPKIRNSTHTQELLFHSTYMASFGLPSISFFHKFLIFQAILENIPLT